jgi:hypothetical protein
MFYYFFIVIRTGPAHHVWLNNESISSWRVGVSSEQSWVQKASSLTPPRLIWIWMYATTAAFRDLQLTTQCRHATAQVQRRMGTGKASWAVFVRSKPYSSERITTLFPFFPSRCNGTRAYSVLLHGAGRAMELTSTEESEMSESVRSKSLAFLYVPMQTELVEWWLLPHLT